MEKLLENNKETEKKQYSRVNINRDDLRKEDDNPNTTKESRPTFKSTWALRMEDELKQAAELTKHDKLIKHGNNPACRVEEQTVLDSWEQLTSKKTKIPIRKPVTIKNWFGDDSDEYLSSSSSSSDSQEEDENSWKTIEKRKIRKLKKKRRKKYYKGKNGCGS